MRENLASFRMHTVLITVLIGRLPSRIPTSRLDETYSTDTVVGTAGVMYHRPLSNIKWLGFWDMVLQPPLTFVLSKALVG